MVHFVYVVVGSVVGGVWGVVCVCMVMFFSVSGAEILSNGEVLVEEEGEEEGGGGGGGRGGGRGGGGLGV